jgi:hypothetical protein
VSFTRAQCRPLRRPSWTANPPLHHIDALMGVHGLFEHADHRSPRIDHGYTVDDNARALVVVGEIGGGEEIIAKCGRFVVAGLTHNGWHNRMTADGTWRDRVGSEDAHGRALWGLGVTVARGQLGSTGRAAFVTGTDRPLEASRAMAYAVLGAAQALADRGARPAARRLLDDYRRRRPTVAESAWRWPEPRLTYDNARIPQAMLACGLAVGDDGLVADGLRLLDWLVKLEFIDDLFAFVPVGGRGPSEVGPAYDQQPLEAWAMVEAAELALAATGDRVWADRAVAAREWFWGRNHPRQLLVDPVTGAGLDGLHHNGVNQNAGAESTLAALGAHVSQSSTREPQ